MVMETFGSFWSAYMYPYYMFLEAEVRLFRTAPCPIGYLSLQIKTKKGECITNFIENVQLYINIVLYF